jgi:hypothetical protein
LRLRELLPVQREELAQHRAAEALREQEPPLPAGPRVFRRRRPAALRVLVEAAANLTHPAVHRLRP